MNMTNYIAVIADDLTGANDTSLQFFRNGASVQVAFGKNICVDEYLHTEVFALSTETRNTDSKFAYNTVLDICENIIKKYHFEHIYKKIDSVLRGNIAMEILALIKSLEYDAAIIFPAFPEEGRTTIGGYQLLNGIPLQRTEVSRDPACPISESNIINILNNQLENKNSDIVGHIPLDIVMKGAGPILIKLNELISSGKKMIVADAVSNVDLEQIALAITKCNYKVLPSGSAGAAQAFSEIWHPLEHNDISSLKIPKLPKLIISGSATDLTALQINTLKSANIQNTCFIPIKPQNIFSNDIEDIAQKILDNLVNENTVIVYSSELTKNQEELTGLLLEKELSKETFISQICDYLASIVQRVISQRELILITVGGETSFKCLQAIGSKNIQIKDTVERAIPLGVDHKGQYIVTKSGNLGTSNTLVDIIKYFEWNII